MDPVLFLQQDFTTLEGKEKQDTVETNSSRRPCKEFQFVRLYLHKSSTNLFTNNKLLVLLYKTFLSNQGFKAITAFPLL